MILSKSGSARRTKSTCPDVMGSKEPGKTAILDIILRFDSNVNFIPANVKALLFGKVKV